MRKLYIVILILSSINSYGQSDFSLLKDTLSLKAKIEKMSKLTNSIESDFIQTKDLSMLSEKIESKGRFCFQKQNNLRWEYDTPYKYVIVINQDKILIKDEVKVKKYDLNSNKVFKEINDIMISCVNGDILHSNKFNINYYVNGSYYMLELIPLSKGMKQSLSKIKMYFDKGVTSVVKLEMVEPSGDNTVIAFINKKLNSVISPEKFTLK